MKVGLFFAGLIVLTAGLFFWTPEATLPDRPADVAPAFREADRPPAALARIRDHGIPDLRLWSDVPATESPVGADMGEFASVPAPILRAVLSPPALLENAPKKVQLSELHVPPFVMRRILEENGLVSLDEPAAPNPLGGGARGDSKKGASSSQTSDLQSRLSDAETDTGLSPWAYRPVLFLPGLTELGDPIQETVDLAAVTRAVTGPPDYSLASKAPTKGTYLSLGNGGVIVLEIVGGYIVDGDGSDFAVFENPFVYNGPDGLMAYAETAVVSVAEVDDPARYRSFPCNSTSAPYEGCAGVTPVRYSPLQPLDGVGGDLFDLSGVGLSRIRYIRIEDTGENRSFMVGTEGFDLDAVGLIHTSG